MPAEIIPTKEARLGTGEENAGTKNMPANEQLPAMESMIVRRADGWSKKSYRAAQLSKSPAVARSASVWCIEWLGAKLDQHRPKGENHLEWKEPKVGQ